jgi:hypothetical protein
MYREGVYDGEGKLTRKNGEEIWGNWSKGMLDGFGAEKDRNEMYKGDYAQGKKVKDFFKFY